jgi:hypothetical protein
VIVLDSESIAAFAGAMLSAAASMLTGMICCDGCNGGNDQPANITLKRFVGEKSTLF